MKRNNIFERIAQRMCSLVVFASVCGGAWAQVTTNRYQTTYNNNDISNTSILHHPGLWYQFRDKLTEEQKAADTFNDECKGYVETLNGMQVQAANVYVDTIYMRKGTSIYLELPYNRGDNTFVLRNYFRWFDFRTEGIYNCNISRSGGTISDLLTPYYDDAVAYRFANGYVSGLLNNNGNTSWDDGYDARWLRDMNFYYPTDEEFNSTTSGFNGGDNDYYVLACDVSSYKDFADTYVLGGSTFGANQQYYEPTLSARTIYYIIGVGDETTMQDNAPEGLKHYWALSSGAYQGGDNSEGSMYLDEYEMTYPSRRLSNYTRELVALSRDARAYIVPGANDGVGTLDIKIDNDDNSAGIALTTDVDNASSIAGSKSGTERAIFFTKQGVDGSLPWKVDDGSTATILVTKTVNGTTYNMARFKLTFKEESTPLTQTQVAGLKDLNGNEGYWWEELTYRSPEYMEENYTLLTSITFDYDESINSENIIPGGNAYHYPFPMDWESTSYAFYGGLPTDDIEINPYEGFPNFGEYGIVNYYYYDDYRDLIPKDLGKNTDGFWFTVDATESPGTVATLKFDDALCQGSKLYVTAWIKSHNASIDPNNYPTNSALRLNIMGVEVDENGKETYTTIHSHNSGQIQHTYVMSDQVDENGLSSNVTGKGTGTDNWFQIYFSFVTEGNYDYDHYVLRIEGNCANSMGADYAFDEVKVYVEHPQVEMTQFDQICSTSGDAQSLMRMDVDYETMMSRLGYDPSDYTDDDETTASIDFVIINEAKYYNALASIEEPTQEQKEAAFKDALVIFYNANGEEHQFPTLDFYLNYEKNTAYDEEEAGSNIVNFNSDDEGYFYRKMNGSVQELSIDCLTDMMAYTEYVILIEPHTETNKSSEQKLDEFLALLNDICAIKTEFYLTSTTILKLNGETIDPTADYCAGQEFVIAPEVTYTNSYGETIYLDNIYFDWFFGSREEYEAANDDFGGVSLQEALLAFRTYYPNAEELSKTETPPTGEGNTAFTQNHYDIIEYYLGRTREGGLNNMLVLHESHLSMRVLNTGLELVIQPIEVILPEDAIDICFGYVPLTLYASGDAPTIKVGFSNINYPDDDYEPCLRLGLAQFEKCGEDTPFTINLHGATYVTEADENGDIIEIDHLGVADGMDMLFLVDTDDPTYHETLLGKEDETEIVVGKVTRLYAKDDNTDDPRTDTPTSAQGIGSYMQMYFYGETDDESDSGVTPFTVKEGYYYVLSVYFQEKWAFDEENNDEPIGTACWGTFPLEIKVVPEYLVWQGDEDDNWNNDNHWKRADRSELNKTASPTTDDPYITNAENGTDNGFVPMLFSKVVIPKDGIAELYMAGFKEGTDETLSWDGDEDTANHDDVSEHPTSNIMYDLMLYGNLTSGALKTEHYRVNLCDQIHLEPGAQVLHSEQLLVDTVWTEIEVPQASWKNVSMPLNNVYAGDWYTKTQTGTETGEYFKYITFDSSLNSRYEPEVYQRSWSTAGSILFDESENNRTTTAYAKTAWSSTYNDTSVPYQSGEGYSVKTFWGNDTSNGVVFRFPKADTEFDYSTATIDRTNSGQLLISKLVDRTDPDGDASDVYVDGEENASVSVNLTKNSSNYYIIGNPYTAHMSMKEFMEKNKNVTSYWLEGTYGPIAGNSDTTSEGYADVLISPYGAFFANIEDEEPIVTFTKDMQKNTETDALVWFSVRATNSIGTTGASLAYDDYASDNYNVGEDVVMMEDTSWQRDGMPMVYTVAGDMAVSVNKVSTMPLIPLGVFADEGCAYTLTFVGTDKLNEPSLIDTYEETETPLTEGFTLDMVGASHGRYFIHSKGAATDIFQIMNEIYDITAYSPIEHTIIVSSQAEIENIDVYSASGMLLRRVDAGGNISCTINGINSGIAIVRAKTSEGTFVKKLRVR